MCIGFDENGRNPSTSKYVNTFHFNPTFQCQLAYQTYELIIAMLLEGKCGSHEHKHALRVQYGHTCSEWVWATYANEHA